MLCSVLSKLSCSHNISNQLLEKCYSQLYRNLQLTQQDQTTASQELSLKTTKSRLAEIEAQYKVIDSENTELRRDKMLLVDHIADLQQKVRTSE